MNPHGGRTCEPKAVGIPRPMRSLGGPLGQYLRRSPEPSQKVTEGPADLEVPGFEAIRLTRALTVVFENGHRLVLDIDLARARDWIAADGTLLL